jgi:Ca2+-transporting ATPase
MNQSQQQEQQNTLWHMLSLAEVAQQTQTNLKEGLSPKEAEERLKILGKNELKNDNQVRPLIIFLAQFKNVLVWILIFAATAALVLGETKESIAIFAIVVLSAILGFIQEYKAENALLALRALSSPKVKVLRGGKTEIIDSVDLVVGDIMLIFAGDKISADARLIEAADLQIEEASLTGESFPQNKNTEVQLEPRANLGDRLNLVYAGTSAVLGRGVAVVFATAEFTEIGKVANMLKTVTKVKTPLQVFLDKLGTNLAILAFFVVILITALGILRSNPILDMLLLGISLAVAVVPEALPAVVTISLAIGVSRMIKRNALVRQLPMVEALGSVSVICTDKTGTLTKGEMTAVKVYTSQGLFDVTGAGYEPKGSFIFNNEKISPFGELLELLRAGTLCGDAVLAEDKKQYLIEGDTTEGALVVMAEKAGLKKTALEQDFPRVEEIAFSSETKRMLTIHKTPGGKTVAFGKGAPESIIPICSVVLKNGELQEFNQDAKNEINNQVIELSKKGFRVIAISKKDDCQKENCQLGMTFLGLVALMDPPRSEAQNAINLCHKAGIKVCMITGDHPETALSIGQSLGLVKSNSVVTGRQLDEMTDLELKEKCLDIDIYARVSPEHKLKIIKAYQSLGKIVSMTGDGVNDAPALKQANVGVAMGITGTEVAKQAAGINLLDDNFATIVAAVEEGRGIFENIKKYLVYLLSSHLGEVVLISLAIIFNWPIPLTAVQVLFVNLACDGPPALALAVEKTGSAVMSQMPRDPKKGVFTKPVMTLFLVAALWTTLVNALMLYIDWKFFTLSASASALTFISLVLIQFFKAYSLKSIEPINYKHLFSNKMLNWSVFAQIPIVVLIVYNPTLQKAFNIDHGFVAIEWVLVILGAATIFPVLEITKKFLQPKS